jgi:hypothetical protein
MPKQPLHGVLENVIEQFAAAIAERAQVLLAKASQGAGKMARSGRGGVRMCPYPGCKNPGNGPRNRWFCKEHSKSVGVREQKRILAERAKSGGAALVVKAKKRVGANKGRKLDMRCRVEGCKNVSRGPRFGFICDEHRKKLSAKEQTAAREKWNAKKAA